MNLSVGDFAEQIMAQDKAEKRATSISEPSFQPDTSVYSPLATDQVDISNVEVPNDFVQSIVENREVVLEETPTPPPAPVIESNDFANMMLEIRDLLVEVKQTLSEINTVGAFAPNLAPKKKKAKKKVKKTPKKQEYEEEEEEDIVELLMKKLRSKVVD